MERPKRKKTNSFSEGVAFKTPEQNLYKAVLCRSITDYQHADDGIETRKEAFAWFLSKDSESPFSFIAICGHLNINHRRVLKNLRLDGYG